MKKIDTNKSLIFDKKINNLKVSLEFLGKEGYFSNNDFSVYIKGTLGSVMVSNKANYPYINEYDNHGFDYFIPKDSVVFIEEPKGKKYRPYTDMCGLPFKVGDVITIRAKDSYDIIEAIVTEISYKENLISIGSREWCDTQFLLDTFEILVNDEWKPLGVEEDEED